MSYRRYHHHMPSKAFVHCSWFQKSLSDQRQQSKVIEDQIGDLKSQKAEIAVKLDTYKEKMGSIANALNHLKTDYAQYKSLKEDLDNSRKELSRWLILEDVHGLDGIQTRIIKKYLPLLNSYIKNYLDIGHPEYSSTTNLPLLLVLLDQIY